ncbi:DUF6376 family protein [Mesobacillus maritimus]|uniref:Lipoprotein n=1 Tax=Mesobacillus maritimus TaxID=1643336 RepID=A0ABS7K981_9BACI|nr:DUF6376 family protein [Mesobacillus maritimus]MBY0098822.1 hypothetical protein [Mesobacillus maritimus]
MRIVKTLLVVAVSMFLSGCSFLGEVNESLDYVNEATTHIDTLNTFAEDAPQLVQEAISDTAAREELETQLVSLQQDIEEFINLNDVPSIAENIHQELVDKNELLLSEINKVLEDGQIAVEKLEESQLFQTVNEVTNLMNQLENLGQ